MRRSRWTTVGLIVVAALVLVFVRINQHQTLSRGWSLYSIGYVLSPSETQTQELVQQAPWLNLPSSLAGLPYGGAVVHPEGTRGIGFVELLYGKMSTTYLDVAESQQPLGVGVQGHRERVAGVAVSAGDITLRGVGRQFAIFRRGGIYYLIVAPRGTPGLEAAIAQIAR